ncbi:MAG: FTR1 family iron permease [Lachnospiraceae bacterium]|nr:FTR1 family iron permease [Lachnospiraceae bacterium]
MMLLTENKMTNQRRRMAVLLLVMSLSLLLPLAARAEEAYYSTWDEYVAGTGLEGATWNHVVDAMDAVLDQAVSTYEGGDAKGAYNGINDAYYGYYETTGFERVAMGYISGARKSEMELQFSACKSVAKKGGSTDDFKQQVEQLKSMLRQDANILDGTTGNGSDAAEEGDTLATELFAENYYATWSEYKEACGLDTLTWNDVTDAMAEVLKTAKETYESGDAKGAYNCINDAYYGYYETTGFERVAMGYISGARKSQMELQFSACKSVTKNGGSTEEFNAEVDTLRSMLREDANILDGTSGDDSTQESSQGTSSGGRSAAVAAFIACFTIILREGFEAILVVGAIIAYLLKTGNSEEDKKKQVRPVYVGSVLGIVLSFVSAWALNMLKLANSASQEVIEGVTALIAVVVLYWVSNWMVSKSESEAWSAYIKSKVKSSSEKGSSFALAFTAFLAVYREGAEVILFYQPMLAGDNINMVWAGFIVGCICLVFVFVAIRVMSLRIPLKPFFLGTSILMFIMSIAFLGSGIKELIEGDVITMSSPAWVAWIPSNSILEILGIYPCVQTVVPQLILLAITIVVFALQLKRNKKLREEAEKEAATA